MAPWITDEMHPLFKEKLAKDTTLEEGKRIEAGLEVVSGAASKKNISNLLYIAGSFKFPKKVREAAGEKLVEIYSREKNERMLGALARRPGYPEKTQRAAGMALDLIELGKKRAKTLKRLNGSLKGPVKAKAKA